MDKAIPSFDYAQDGWNGFFVKLMDTITPRDPSNLNRIAIAL
jgi:hypothetical protein